MIIKKIYKSKKNKVMLVEKHSELFIKKEFSDSTLYDREKNFYLETKDQILTAPKLIHYCDEKNELYIEYIKSETVLSKLEECEEQQEGCKAYSLLIRLITYLKEFSDLKFVKSNELCFYDLNLRNFLLHENRVVGIDFEDIRQGSFKQDVVKALAMYLLYDPILTDFKINTVELVKVYLEKEYDYCVAEFSKLINEEISKIKKRRGLNH